MIRTAILLTAVSLLVAEAVRTFRAAVSARPQDGDPEDSATEADAMLPEENA